MEASGTQLRMSLSDVASLANVQRPVVSMWRKRSSGSPAPFPAAIGQDHGREVFNADQVAAWLAATGRGNNPEAQNDVAAFAKLSALTGRDGQAQDPRIAFDGLTALLALKVVTGGPVSGLARDELLDSADACDPDDLFLYSELESLGAALPATAAYAERIVDSAYSTPAAFEKLLADRFRSGLREHADTALTDAAVDLVAAAAVELASALDADPVFIDSSKGGSDLLLGIVQRSGDAGPLTLLTADDDGAASRLVRRRLHVHGVDSGRVRLDANQDFDVHDPAVHVAQYPAPGNPAISPREILSAIENTVLQMDDAQRAVIIAPARVLCDPSPSPEESALRSDLLRSGRVRAIVRLPQGLLRSKPRETQALWVLGPSFADVGIADRWTMLADLSAQKLTDGVSQDLISDIAASMGRRATIRAHSFRFARLIQTRLLLANRGSLMATAQTSRTGQHAAGPSGSAETALRIDELVRVLETGKSSCPLDASVLPTAQNVNSPRASVQELIAAGNLNYIKGNRLDEAHLTRAAGSRVVGTAELLDPHYASLRRISLLDFAAGYPSGRLTQPGDVVFCTSPRPAAIVDADGGSVVVFPARVLRIDDGDPGGLMPEVVAADINAATEQDKDWRQWRLRRMPDAQRRPLTNALAKLQHEQSETRQRLKQLDELATLILDGVASGSLTLTDPADTEAPNEGTR